MGNCCKGSSDAPPAKVSADIHAVPDASDELNDLSSPSTFGVSDKYRLFELKLPFQRIQVNHFIVKVKIAEQSSGAEGYVTLKTLRQELQTPAWKDLEDENSELSRFLLSPAFKKKGQSGDQIDSECLQIFALLNSPGKTGDKAEHVYNLLQGADSSAEVHTHISATDKDLIPFFDKLCGLACGELMEQSAAIGAVRQIYEEEDIENMKYQIEVIREDQYLEDIYGVQSRIENQVWMQKMCKEAKWVFDTADIRKRILEAAGIDAKHFWTKYPDITLRQWQREINKE